MNLVVQENIQLRGFVATSSSSRFLIAEKKFLYYHPLVNNVHQEIMGLDRK